MRCSSAPSAANSSTGPNDRHSCQPAASLRPGRFPSVFRAAGLIEPFAGENGGLEETDLLGNARVMRAADYVQVRRGERG